MTKLIHFQLFDLPDCRIVGKELVIPKMDPQNNPVPAFWDKCFAENIFEPLEKMTSALFPDALYDAAGAYLDWMGDLQPDGSYRCIVGMVMKPGAIPPEGYAFMDLPACQLALGQVQGPESEVYAAADKLLPPLIRQAGKSAGDYMIEVYACPRFTTPDPVDHTVVLDYYLQVK